MIENTSHLTPPDSSNEILELFKTIRERNHRLYLDDNDNLKLDIYDGELTDELRGEIASNKAELISFLKSRRSFSALRKVEEKAFYPASSAQKRLYFLYEFNRSSLAYNMPYVLRLEGNFDKERLQQAFQRLIDRHQILRTTFHVIDGEVVQKVLEKVPFSIDTYISVEEEVSGVAERFIRSFDLAKAPLIRVGLIQMATDVHVLMVDMHHIISDGTSQGFLISELMSLYAGGEPAAPQLHYKDYAEWQNSTEHQEQLASSRAFWLNAFEGEVQVLDLPTDYPRPRTKDHAGAVIDFNLNPEQTRQLEGLSREQGATMFMTLLSLLNVLLSKLGGQENIVVGTPTTGRNHADLEDMIGMFVNTLPLCNHVVSSLRFSEFLQSVKAQTIASFDHQDYQYEDLVEELQVVRDASRNPLFDVMFAYQNFDRTTFELPGLKLTDLNTRNKISKFDLLLFGSTSDGRLQLNFEYSAELFQASTIKRFVAYFHQIVNQVLADPDIQLSRINILAETGELQLLHAFNGTAVDYEKDKSLIDLFEFQVAAKPNSNALIHDGKSLTYKDLNNRANQLAAQLLKLGLTKSETVGLMVDRSFEMVISILAILKGGGVCLPIDPDFPSSRIQFILKDAQSNLVLVETKTALKLKACGYSGILLNLSEIQFSEEEFLNPSITVFGDDQIYVIYTSGSTGTPKGVILKHANLHNLIHYCRQRTSITFDNVLQFTTLTFDVAFQEIFSTLLAGGRLTLVSKEDVRDINRLFAVIHENEVETLFMSASLINQWFNDRNSIQKVPGSLKHIVSAGDQLFVGKEFKKYLQANKVYLHNHYGPSETHVVTAHTLSPEAEIPDLPSIGKPIFNTQIYVFDKHQNFQPIGVVGEIYIGGDQVGLGYINNDSLTSERFIENPFKKGSLLYRTGDIGRWLQNGDLEYLGRIDNQVKVRGFRVELGEVENCLLGHALVRESAVIIKTRQQEKLLVGYHISDETLPSSAIRGYLSEHLPEYMIPSYFVQLDEFPYTTSGKLNRKALPDPKFGRHDNYVPPTSELEDRLVDIWSEVLALNNTTISVEESFFELGGHSLKAMVLVNHLSRHLGVQLPVKDIFVYQDIRSLSTHILGLSGSNHLAIPKTSIRDYYSTSSAQQRLYFLYEFDKDSLAYNMPAVVRLEGQLDRLRLEQAFRQLISRHEILRTSLHLIEDEVVQKVHDDSEFNVDYYASDEAGIPAIIEEFIRPFNLNEAPLIRVGLIEISATNHILMVDMHHIISDGTSHGVLIDDFMRVYAGEAPEELRLQYKDYSEWLYSEAYQERILLSKAYWLEVFSKESSVLDLPVDYSRPKVKDSSGAIYLFSLEEEEVSALRSLSDREGVTMFMMLLSIFNVLLSKLTNQEDIIVGTPTSGRNHADLERMIGMFINTLVLRNYPKGDLTFVDFLQSVKENTLESFGHQEYQYEDLVEALNVVRDTSRNPLFDVMFSYQNFESSELEIPGLTLRGYDLEHKNTKFDLTLTGGESERQIFFHLRYSTQLFKAETIERFARQFRQIVTSLIHSPPIKLEDLSILLEEDKRVLEQAFDAKRVTYPEHANVIARFDAQAAANPSGTALVDIDDQLSYGELSTKTKRLAQYLLHHGEATQELCFVMAHSSVPMIVSALSVLRAGKIFVPISNDLPDDQIAELIDKYQPGWVIIHGDWQERLKLFQSVLKTVSARVCFHDLRPIPERDKASFPVFVSEDVGLDLNLYKDPELHADQPCYIYFTSGSTSRPKAILGAFAGLSHFIDWEINYLGLGTEAKVSQLITSTFDAFFRDLFVPLCSGGTLFIPPRSEGILKVDELANWVIRHKINVLHCGPSLLREIMVQSTAQPLEDLRYVLTSGEAIYGEDVKRWSETFGQRAQLVNLYGPSETTLVKFVYAIDYQQDQEGDISIGQPIPGCTAILLDENLHPVAPGTIGEVYIRTPYQTLGYYDDPLLTATSFIQHPMFKDTYDSLYKTGDLAIEGSDGNYSFIGRKDNQVKIQGIRVELGVIESHLIGHPSVEEAVVFYDQEAQVLGASLHAHQHMTTEQITQHLSEFLPNYMIPVHYHFKADFPKSGNGKVDRNRLRQEWEESLLQRKTEFRAPETEEESRLQEVWSDVLGLEQATIGTEANFFELGGNSLKAMVLVGQLSKAFEVLVAVKDIFAYQDIRSLAKHISGLSVHTHEAIPAAEVKDYYPTSSAQQRLYFLYEFDKDSLAYNMPAVVRLEGQLDRLRLEQAFRQLISRHEILRTSLHLIEDEVVQKVHDDSEFNVDYYASDEAGIPAIIEEFIRPFNLNEAPLIRVGLIEISATNHILMVDMHHIISDGTSHGVLIDDFMRVYAGEAPEELRLQYKDYSEWLYSEAYQERILLSKAYWLEVFSKESSVLDLPVDYSRPKVKDSSGAIYLFSLEEEEVSALRSLSDREGVTMFMMLLSIFNVLLSKLTNQEDIIVGTPTSGRNHADLERMIGMFINTLVLRNYPKGDLTFVDFLQSVKENTLESFGHQEYQYEDLVEALNVVRDTSRNPLFDVMFSYQNFESSELEIPGLTLRGYDLEHKNTKFDLTLTGGESERQIFFHLRYSTQLFKAETIERFARQFRQIVTSLIHSPPIKLEDLSILLEEDKRVLEQAFDAKRVTYPEHANVIARFDAQAAANPSGTALVDIDDQLSYGELSTKTKRLAQYLLHHGEATQELCFVMAHSSVPMIVSALSVLRAGKIFVPISNDLPDDQIAELIDKYQPGWVIIHGDWQERLKLFQSVLKTVSARVCFHDLRPIPERDKASFPVFVSEDVGLDLNLYKDPELHADQPCYIYFTSGSTSRPKAILGAFAGLSHFIDWEINYLGLGTEAKVSQLITSTFDAFFRDLFVPLCSGGTLFIPPRSEGILKVDELANWVIRHKINVLHCGPSLLREIMVQSTAQPLEDLRYVLTSGEAIYGEDVKRWSETFGQRAQLVNLYGPSETTLVKFVYAIDYQQDQEGDISIGQPIPGCTAILLDENLHPVAPGTIGEVYIRTPYQTLGYYDDPLLTATSFIQHPMFKDTYDSLYKTGDLAIEGSDGNYSFIGRKDNQVKIQGIRVELGVIESHLIGHPSVEEAVVFYDQEAQVLGASLHAHQHMTTEQITQHLSEFLPNYMIPVHYHFKADFPKSGNGKVDRNRLRQEWEESLLQRKTEFRAPETEEESRLQEVWSDVLGLEQATIGTEANFFELGGNSLKAMVLVGQLSKAFEVLVAVKDIFAYQDIRSLAKHISGLSVHTHEAIPVAEVKDYYPTSSAQQRLYFLYEFDKNSLAYNMPRVVRLEGQLDRLRLEQAFRQLINRHEILRSSIHLVEDEVVQKVHQDFTFAISSFHSDEQGIPIIIEEFVLPFDLEDAPLFRVGLIQVESRNHVMIVDMHHIICDGTSHELLIKEFMALYNDEPLDTPVLHYKDFSEWQRGSAHNNRITRAKDFWLGVFDEEASVLDLPWDHRRPAIWEATGDIAGFTLDQTDESALKAFSEREGVTMFITLLSIFNVFLSKLSNQEDIVIGTPTSGRNHADLKDMIGMFVNTLALRNCPKGDLTFVEFANSVKENALESFDHQEYQYEDLVEILNVVRDTSRNPLFDVMFSYQNFDRTSLSIQDLSLEAYPTDYQIAKFDLTLSVLELEEGLRFVFEYSTQLFEQDSISRFIRYFKQVVAAVLEKPDIAIAGINLLSEDERNELIFDHNQTDLEFDQEISVQQLFEDQVVLQPQSTALVYEEENINYQELNQRSNQVAHYLRSQGVKPNKVVGLLMERSADMIIGLLGVIKSGGAYLPIDASLPTDRIDYYLTNSGVELLLTNSSKVAECDFEGLTIEISGHSIVEQSDENPEPINSPDDLLYVIYTSGSTGRPKGVMVNHQNYLNVTGAWFDAYELDRLSVNLLQIASFSFDVFSGDVARALLSGGKMVVCPEDVRLEPENLYEILRRESINIFESTPSLIVPLMSYISESGLDIGFMKLLILGSDVCSVADFRWLLEDFGDTMRIVNSYGVTETTIDSSFYETSLSELPSSGNVPIGRPLGNVKYYVLDRHLSLLPKGVIGELYIGGRGVSSGYIGSKALTDDSFLENPFLADERIYKTGDLVRWLLDGNLEFLGRADDQVKIRGYRIELGEIESHLLHHDEITEAVVIPKGKQGDQHLIGYYISEKEISPKAIKGYLLDKIPEYMLPSFFVQLDGFQLTSNGKIDRKNLPDPTFGGEEKFMAPADEVEEKLVEIWSKVLNVEKERIGVNDHFFDVGGNSLKIIKLKSMIVREFSFEISVAQLFTYTTIATIRNFIREGELDVEQYEKQSDAEVDLFENLIRNLN